MRTHAHLLQFLPMSLLHPSSRKKSYTKSEKTPVSFKDDLVWKELSIVLQLFKLACKSSRSTHTRTHSLAYVHGRHTSVYSGLHINLSKPRGKQTTHFIASCNVGALPPPPPPLRPSFCNTLQQRKHPSDVPSIPNQVSLKMYRECVAMLGDPTTITHTHTHTFKSPNMHCATKGNKVAKSRFKCLQVVYTKRGNGLPSCANIPPSVRR